MRELHIMEFIEIQQRLDKNGNVYYYEKWSENIDGVERVTFKGKGTKETYENVMNRVERDPEILVHEDTDRLSGLKTIVISN